MTDSSWPQIYFMHISLFLFMVSRTEGKRYTLVWVVSTNWKWVCTVLEPLLLLLAKYSCHTGWMTDPVLVCLSQNASLWEGSFIFAFSSCSLNWRTAENLYFFGCGLKRERPQIVPWGFPVRSFVQIDCWRLCQRNDRFKGGDSKNMTAP